MTVKRDLKKRVRARQSRTGERYTTALQQVRAERPAVPVVEMVDVSAVATGLGLKGRVLMFPDLAERVDAGAVMERIRDVLLRTERDPGTRLFRGLLLHGEGLAEGRARFMAREAALLTALLYGYPLPTPSGMADAPSDGWRFLERARAGLGGVSESGLMLAVPVPAREGLENVVAMIWGLPLTPSTRWATSVVLRSASTVFSDVSELEELARGRGTR